MVFSAADLHDTNDMWSFYLITNHNDRARLMIGSDRDNFNSTNRYECNAGSYVTSDINITDVDFVVETPVIAYSNDDYTKTISLTVTREIDLPRGLAYFGYNFCHLIN